MSCHRSRSRRASRSARRFIYAGLADRLVHPQHQVHELWTQWEQPEISWFRGSHIGFFFSRPVQEFIVDALTRADVIPVATAAAEPA